MARHWSNIANFNIPHLYLAPPLGVTPLEFRRNLWHQKARVPGLSYGIVCVILRLVQYQRVRRMNGGTQDKSIYHLKTVWEQEE